MGSTGKFSQWKSHIKLDLPQWLCFILSKARDFFFKSQIPLSLFSVASNNRLKKHFETYVVAPCCRSFDFSDCRPPGLVTCHSWKVLGKVRCGERPSVAGAYAFKASFHMLFVQHIWPHIWSQNHLTNRRASMIKGWFLAILLNMMSASYQSLCWLNINFIQIANSQLWSRCRNSTSKIFHTFIDILPQKYL